MSSARSRQRVVVPALCLVLGAFLLWVSAPGIAPAVRAARGDGTPGTFTARSLTCIGHPGHESCSWTGDYRSADGRLAKTGVQLAGSGRGSLRAGDRTRAIDVGRPYRVYGPDGSKEWIVTAALLLAGLLLVAFAGTRLVAVPAVPHAHSTR